MAKSDKVPTLQDILRRREQARGGKPLTWQEVEQRTRVDMERAAERARARRAGR